jgi:L-ribulokinase
MTGLKADVYKPDPAAGKAYRRLYALYRQLHDAFGTRDWSGGMHNVMKDLLEIRSAAR